ncbi:hypothetical protein OSCI_3000015 [Kamptonema sp. PCC 6506]|nr:hypothetical protein OSCI_3000015 [Kamptonema sp. PCC 6506]
MITDDYIPDDYILDDYIPRRLKSRLHKQNPPSRVEEER